MKLTLYVPTLDDLWFRRRMLEDPETMAYNRAWGGTIRWPGKGGRPGTTGGSFVPRGSGSIAI